MGAGTHAPRSAGQRTLPLQAPGRAFVLTRCVTAAAPSLPLAASVGRCGCLQPRERRRGGRTRRRTPLPVNRPPELQTGATGEVQFVLSHGTIAMRPRPLPETAAVLVAAVLLLIAASPSPVAAAGCPERPRCTGCGCKGGPGYRSIVEMRCVGFQELHKVCGSPPATTKCVFENAAGTGANQECALAPRKKGGASS